MDIIKKFKKKKLTGKELGQIQLYNSLTYHKRIVQGETAETIIPLEEIQARINELKDPEDIAVVNKYIHLNKWLQFNRINPFPFQAQANFIFGEISKPLYTAFYAERAYQALEPLLSETTDEEALYNVYSPLRELMLDKYAGKNKEIYQRAKSMREAHYNAFFDSYYYCLGYNVVIDTIKELFETGDIIDVIKISLDYIQESVGIYNDSLEKIKNIIAKGNYVLPDAQEKKFKILEDMYPALDLEAIVIPEEAIEKLRNTMLEPNAFDTHNVELIKIVGVRKRHQKEQ